MKICGTCLKHLRVTYNFLKTVRNTQESINQFVNLKYGAETELIKENVNLREDSCKVDGESEYEVKEQLVVTQGESLEDLLLNSEENVKDGELQKATKKVRSKPDDLVFECTDCDFLYTNQCQLMRHLKRTHHKEKNFICTYCNEGFKKASHLRDHIVTHTGERNFSCPICDKTFLRASTQRRHVKAHEAAPGQKTKRTPFLCTICGKNFPFSNGVQRHMRTHLGIRKHECNVCKRKFMQSTHLYVHMRTHTGEKPYVCDICGEAFSLNCSLRKHMNAHNSVEEKKTLKSDSIKESVA